MFGAQIAIITIGSIFYLPFKTFFMKKIMIIIGTCLLGALANNAQAQATSATDVLQSSMTLNDAITLDVSAGSGGPDAVFNTIAEYTNGITKLLAAHAVVSSTQDWKLEVEAVTADFVGTSTIPASKLLVGPAGGSLTALSQTKTLLFDNQPFTALAAVDMDYKFDPGFNHYVAGVYTIDVLYTATQL